MAPSSKKKAWNIVKIAGICAAILTISGFSSKIDTFAQERYLVPIIHKEITEHTNTMCDMVKVMYKYNKKEALRNQESTDNWNNSVDEVSNENKISKIEGK